MHEGNGSVGRGGYKIRQVCSINDWRYHMKRQPYRNTDLIHMAAEFRRIWGKE